ncbi:MAG TPA: polyprenyl synthetase family protein [Ktedonobacterales bacterium]
MADSAAEELDAAVETILGRHRTLIAAGLHRAVKDAARQLERASPSGAAPSETTMSQPAAGVHEPAAGVHRTPLLAELVGQIEYHLGWRHPDLSPAHSHPGKLLRPTLVLLAAELAAGRAGIRDPMGACGDYPPIADQALPAAVCVELVHNFSLIHDDIEDSDEERRHRPTLWKLWGVPQAINTGDALFSLARLSLWQMAEQGIAPPVVVQVAALIDRTCLDLCAGQFLDMRFEGRRDVSVAMYLDMIERKTAALMACATEAGARIAAPGDEALAAELGRFGRALGVAFQLRDDLLGIWSAGELGKTPAGDLRRKKMTLPVLHALESAAARERRALEAIYEAPGPASEAQIAVALEVLEHAGARERVRTALRDAAAAAREALDGAAGDATGAREARDQLATLLAFVAAAAD